MNKFGRKWTMMGLVAPFLIGWILLIFARNFVMLLIGRLFIGLAGGAFCISAPLYSAEIAEKEIRGIIGTFFQLLINLGILFVYCIGPYLSVLWTNITCALVAVAFGVVFFFMPESPVYLIIKNRDEEAKKSYKWLRGESFNPEHEIKELKDELAETEKNKMRFSEVMKQRASKMATFIGFGLATFQQMSGINVVIFYSTRIFEVSFEFLIVCSHDFY
jgi:MFS family permease